MSAFKSVACPNLLKCVMHIAIDEAPFANVASSSGAPDLDPYYEKIGNLLVQRFSDDDIILAESNLSSLTDEEKYTLTVGTVGEASEVIEKHDFDPSLIVEMLRFIRLHCS